jgi:hypothetical protein
MDIALSFSKIMNMRWVQNGFTPMKASILSLKE